MNLLSNNKVKNHKAEILNAIQSAEEIIICTAFLKYSGLKTLLEAINKKEFKTTFYVGTNFYQTEPNALKQLFTDGHIIYLNRDKIPTFHPKIFFFRNQNKVKLYVGSANLTSGGLETNIETSIECDITIDSLLHSDLIEQLKYFNSISKRIEILETILDYEKRYKIYREKQKIAITEFEKEEEIIIENEKLREEERKRKVEEAKLKNKQAKITSDKLGDRFAISNAYKENWIIKFEEFKQFKIENNGNTIIPKTDKLYNWYKRQRELYGHLDENGNRAIPPEHLVLLNSENFFWGNPNEIQWMLKWENNLKLAVEYSEVKKQKFTWVYREKKNPQFKYKRQSQWCNDQRMRLNGEPSKRKITPYEIKRLNDVKFLEESDELTRQTNEVTILERLIQIETYKKERLAVGNRKWLPSQTDKDDTIADLGNWLNDKIESIKAEKKEKAQRKITNEVEEQLVDLGINIEYGITGSYFDYNVKEYLKMREKFPIDFPKGEERKKYEADIRWAILNKSKFHTYPEWRQKKLREIGIVKSPNS